MIDPVFVLNTRSYSNINYQGVNNWYDYFIPLTYTGKKGGDL